MDISGQTKLAAVIGSPIKHSLSPLIHNAGFQELDLDWIYAAFEVPEGGGRIAVESMRALGIGGLSVTMPLKNEVALSVDELTPSAQALESCNCVYWEGDKLIGDSTDGRGFVSAFELETGSRLSGKKVMVIGAGGAARSIIQSLGETGAESIVIVNRSESAAKSAIKLASQAVVGSAGDVSEVDVVVNATSIGMTGSANPLGTVVDPNDLVENQIIADIVYNPVKTPFLSAAEAKGLETVSGIGMLVHQAGIAFENWTKKSAPLQAMHGAASAMIN